MPRTTRREALHAVITTALIGTTGCTSRNQAAGQSPTDTASPPSSASPTPTATPIPESLITEFTSLTEKGQELFQSILAEGTIERPSDDIPSKLWEAEYVRYEGDVFELSKSDTGRSIAVYTLRVAAVEERDVDTSELVAYSDLSEEAKSAFQHAVQYRRYSMRGEPLPGKLDEAGFVKYNGSYYELLVSVSDIRVWELSATKARD